MQQHTNPTGRLMLVDQRRTLSRDQGGLVVIATGLDATITAELDPETQ